MTYCTCWIDYPNESHQFKNGHWKCIDKYKCIRHLETIPLPGLPFPKYVRKTMCEKIKEEESMIEPNSTHGIMTLALTESDIKVAIAKFYDTTESQVEIVTHPEVSAIVRKIIKYEEDE